MMRPAALLASAALALAAHDVRAQRLAGGVANPSDSVNARSTHDVRSISLERFSSSAGRGEVVGIVVTKETGAPLPFADLRVEPFDATAFTGAGGGFRLTNVPAGTITIRARLIGRVAASASVEVRAGATDTVHIRLPAIALQLEQVRVSEALCSEASRAGADTAVLVILTQLQLSAERSQLLAREYPFEMILQRTIANEADTRDALFRRVDTLQVDTISATVDPTWRYEPGNLFEPSEPTRNRRIRASERMMIPQLGDFADPTFIASHCFQYAGVRTVDGERLLEVSIEPVRGLRAPDVRGSIYLDAMSYQIRRSTLYFERESPQGDGDVWFTRVDTRFRDLVPSLPVIERISQRTTLTPQYRAGESGPAATEVQRLIDVRFQASRPTLPRIPPGIPNPTPEPVP